MSRYVALFVHGVRWTSVPPFNILNFTRYTCLIWGSRRAQMASARTGFCGCWSSWFRSKAAGGWLHNSYLNTSRRSSAVFASNVSLWKRSCVSIWTDSPSILTVDFLSSVTTWCFRLKVYSATASPSIPSRIDFPTVFALSTLTVLWVLLSWYCAGCLSLRVSSVSFQSRAYLALVMFLFCSPVS